MAERSRPIDAIKASLSTRYSFIVGCDLAKLQDKSVLSVIEGLHCDKGDTYALKAIETLPARMDYISQGDAIAAFMQRPQFKTWGGTLVIDGTGIGEAVCDYLKSAHALKFKKLKIVAGDGRNGLKISRNWLLNNLRKWIQTPATFAISSDLQHADELRQELDAIEPKYRADGGLYYAAGEHDDFVMSLALALAELDRRQNVRSGTTDYFFSNL